MAWSVWWVPLDPAAATPPQLVRWLCTNLAKEQPDIWQKSLYQRCEREVLSPNSTIDWEELASALQTLTPAQQRCWTENLDWLGGTWFRQEAAKFLASPAGQRPEALLIRMNGWCDCELKYLAKVYELSQTTPPQPGVEAPSQGRSTFADKSLPLASFALSRPAGPQSPLILIQRVVQRWIDTAPPAEQKGLREFWGAVQWQFFTQPQLWKKLPISPTHPVKN